MSFGRRCELHVIKLTCNLHGATSIPRYRVRAFRRVMQGYQCKPKQLVKLMILTT